MPQLDKVYLSFDLDWADDVVLAALLDRLEALELPATIFITHATPLLERMRANPRLELGLHPNFRPLLRKELQEKGQPETAGELLGRLKDLVPEAVSVRPHCLIDSQDFFPLYAACGLTHESGLMLPFAPGQALRPFRYLSGVIRVPCGFEDNVHFLGLEEGWGRLAAGEPSSPGPAEPSAQRQGCGGAGDWSAGPFLEAPGLKVFNFHPIHLYLNTERPARYEAARPYFRNPEVLADLRCQAGDRGTAVLFEDLLAEAAARKMEFGLIREIEA